MNSDSKQMRNARNRVCSALNKTKKSKASIEYLGIDIPSL